LYSFYSQRCYFRHLHQSIHICFRRLGDIFDTWISGPENGYTDRQGGPERRGIGFCRLSRGGGADAVVESLGHLVFRYALHTWSR